MISGCGPANNRISDGAGWRRKAANNPASPSRIVSAETILEGEAGLFAAFRRQPAPSDIRLFAGPQPEIMAVYNKPAPACNFAQTAAQTALRVARQLRTSEDIATVAIRVPEA